MAKSKQKNKDKQKLKSDSSVSIKASSESQAEESPKGEKLQKVLARAGVGSRREMERWIEQGRFGIDGRRATLGDRIFPTQLVTQIGRAHV